MDPTVKGKRGRGGAFKKALPASISPIPALVPPIPHSTVTVAQPPMTPLIGGADSLSIPPQPVGCTTTTSCLPGSTTTPQQLVKVPTWGCNADAQDDLETFSGIDSGTILD